MDLVDGLGTKMEGSWIWPRADCQLDTENESLVLIEFAILYYSFWADWYSCKVINIDLRQLGNARDEQSLIYYYDTILM